MRVTGGTFGGRLLATPKTDAIRPTSDRIREAVFNVLVNGGVTGPLDGKRVIDLFAGTGALGVEALSRGAAHCLFVDDGAEARGLIRRNVEALSLTGVTRVFRRDATKLGPAGNLGRFDLAVLDPPYGRGLGELALRSLAEGGWLAPGATAVLEERAGAEIAVPPGYRRLDERTWGDTQVLFVARDFETGSCD